MARTLGVLLIAVTLASGCAFWEMSDWSDNAGKPPSSPSDEGGANLLDASVHPEGSEDAAAGDAAPDAGVLAHDSFERVVAEGFGTADIGGPWTNGGNSDVTDRVENGHAAVTIPTAGRGMVAALKEVVARDSESEVVFTIDKTPIGGSGFYTSMFARADANNDGYEARIVFREEGVVATSIAKSVNGVANVLPGGKDAFKASPGERVRAKFRVAGTNATSLRLKVWKATESEPVSWLIETSDGDAAFQDEGIFGIRLYLATGTTSLPLSVTIDDLLIRPPTP